MTGSVFETCFLHLPIITVENEGQNAFMENSWKKNMFLCKADIKFFNIRSLRQLC